MQSVRPTPPKLFIQRVFLLTITAQVVARHVYETHGFHRVWSRDKSEWGEGVIEERWDLELS